MNYGFLTKSDIFYSYRIFCQGVLIACGDGSLTCNEGLRTASAIAATAKDGIKDSVIKDKPSLVGKDLVIDIISLNRI